MRNLLTKAAALSVLGLFTTGCVVYEQPRPVVVEQPQPVETAVVVGPGVEVIEVEPDPVDRVYVYDEGYPPGCYVYGDYYFYNGYRYRHDEFVRQVVTVNVRERRFVNVEENRRAGVQIEVQHRQEFAVNHGRPSPAEHRSPAAARPAATHGPALRPDRRPGAQASVRE